MSYRVTPRDKPPSDAPSIRGQGVRRTKVRRGVAVLLVLAFLCISMSLTYSLIRTSSTSVLVRGNHLRRATARDAAYTGMMIARRRIHEATWQGVDSSVEGTLGPDVGYRVTFQVGDADLQPSDPDYAEYPYRLTLVSHGYARDPVNPASKSVHEMRAVVQLVRRSVVPAPNEWTQVSSYTMVQWADEAADFELPVRIEGKSYFGGRLRLADDIPAMTGPAFRGLIDEVAFFDQEIEASSFAEIYFASLGYSGRYPHVAAAYEAHTPVHWWRLNESYGTDAAADSGSEVWTGAYHGAFLGAPGPPFARQSSNRSIFLDGVDDYVHLGNDDLTRPSSVVADSSQLPPRQTTGTPFTVMAWILPSGRPNEEIPLFTKTVGTRDQDYCLALSLVPYDSGFQMRARIRTTTGNNVVTSSGVTLPPDRWHFVGITYDGRFINFYRNGIRVDQVPAIHSGDVATHRGPVQIGASPAIRDRLLRDLGRAERDSGVPVSPFVGPVAYNPWRTSLNTASNLRADLGLATETAVPVSTNTQVSTVERYQLYPGGPYYPIPVMRYGGSKLQLGPDPRTNPLGVYRYTSSRSLYSDCDLRGVLIGQSGARLTMNGPRISLSGVALPPLESGDTLQLPTLLARGPVEIRSGAEVAVQGCVVVDDRLEIRPGPQSDAFSLDGQLLARELRVRERDEWDRSDSWWSERLTAFFEQLDSSTPIPYFHKYLESVEGLTATPRIEMRRADPTRSYHWHDWSKPVFQPHPDDPGLRWRMIRMFEIN